MTTPRDFLTPPATALGSAGDRMELLLRTQNDYLAEIARQLSKQNASVLCSAVVKGTSQQGTTQNSISDNKQHEVYFEVGGKAVEIYSLLAYSTFSTGTIGLGILSLSKVSDGIPFANGDTLYFPVPIRTVYVQTAADVSVNPLVINGPANATAGGLFLYGFTIPNWEQVPDNVAL